MKFMITIIIKNTNNQNLKLKLEKIINNEELDIDNILGTVNKEKHYDKLIITLKNLSQRIKTMKNYQCCQFNDFLMWNHCFFIFS